MRQVDTPKNNILFFKEKEILPGYSTLEVDEVSPGSLKQEIPNFSLKKLEPIFYSHLDRAKGIVEALENTSCFEENVWKEMDIDARKETLIDFNKQISDVLEISPCDISFEKLPPEYRGYQCDCKIVLNTDLVARPENMYQAIETLAHETYHQYQREAIANPRIHNDPAEVKEWEDNFDNYFDPEVYGFELYFEQPVESSAREFAAEIKEDIIAQNSKNFLGSDYSVMA